MRAGEVVAFPTDTVYGLGTLLTSRVGIARIYEIKGRTTEKALPVLVADPGQLAGVIDQLTPQARRLMERFWPGALTLVLPRHPSVPAEIALGRGSIGVRAPNHPDLLALLRTLGAPVASSSANRSGAPAAATAQEVADAFFQDLALILDGGPAGGVASTVVDLTRPNKPVLLRAGALPRAALEEALGRPLLP
jgi:L-threonylcarbamoyladenylate synthase